MPLECVTSVRHDHSNTVKHTDTLVKIRPWHALRHRTKHASYVTFFQDVCVPTFNRPLTHRSKPYHKRRYLRSTLSTLPLFLHPNRPLHNKKHSTSQKMPFKLLAPHSTPSLASRIHSGSAGVKALHSFR